MTLKDMAYFCTAAEEKNITKAAAVLYIAQPALSQCILKLEKEMNAELFILNSNGVEMTDEGKCFYEFAMRTLSGQRDFQKKMADIRNAERGEIRVGFTGTQAACVLPHFLPGFQTCCPHIHVSLIEAASNEIEEKLVSGAVDIGILHPPILRQELETFELSRDRMVIVPRSCSFFEPFLFHKEREELPYLDLSFLRDEPLAVTQPRQRSRMETEQILARAGVTPVIRQTSGNLTTMDALAQVDYATVLLPEKQLSEELRKRGYFLIDEKYSVPYSFHAAVLKEGYLSQAAKRLLEYLETIRNTF